MTLDLNPSSILLAGSEVSPIKLPPWNHSGGSCKTKGGPALATVTIPAVDGKMLPFCPLVISQVKIVRQSGLLSTDPALSPVLSEHLGSAVLPPFSNPRENAFPCLAAAFLTIDAI